jgi:hypothetical protein
MTEGNRDHAQAKSQCQNQGWGGASPSAEPVSLNVFLRLKGYLSYFSSHDIERKVFRPIHTNQLLGLDSYSDTVSGRAPLH